MEDIKSYSSLNKTNNLNNNNIDDIDNFDISLKNAIHTLNYHKNSILYLSTMNGGRLISGSINK